MNSKQIYLIRHCAATGQDPEAPLSLVGEEQAYTLADHLATEAIQSIVASPFLRAQASIRPLAQRLNLKISTDPRLAERTLSRKPLTDWCQALEQSFSELDRIWGGGESSRTALKRGRSVIDELLKGGANRVAVVTHGNLMTLILHSFDPSFGFESWKALSNPDVFLLTCCAQTTRIQRIWPA